MKSKTVPELVREFADGDQAAYAELVGRYRKKIYYVAWQILGNHLDADEVVQETFVRIYKKRRELRDVKNFTSFLIRVATNYAIDLLRKQKGRGTAIDDPSAIAGDVQIELSRKVRTPIDEYRGAEIMKEIWKALATLPPRQRITAILHDIEGHTKTEIAAIMECPEATVRSNLHIARTKLKKLLRKRLDRRSKK